MGDFRYIFLGLVLIVIITKFLDYIEERKRRIELDRELEKRRKKYGFNTSTTWKDKNYK